MLSELFLTAVAIPDDLDMIMMMMMMMMMMMTMMMTTTKTMMMLLATGLHYIATSLCKLSTSVRWRKLRWAEPTGCGFRL